MHTWKYYLGTGESELNTTLDVPHSIAVDYRIAQFGSLFGKPYVENDMLIF